MAKPRALACGWCSTVVTGGLTLTGGCESATLQCAGPGRLGAKDRQANDPNLPTTLLLLGCSAKRQGRL